MNISSPLVCLWYFFIYAFLGWVVEVAYHAVHLGKLVNRGFLNGPVCPIYGFGMVGILLLLEPVEHNLVLLFLGATCITTSIELFGGWMLFKLFHTRWWDYSNAKFNLGGYICLRFSLYWGFCTLAVIRLVQPVVALFVRIMPSALQLLFAGGMSALFLLDIAVSASIAAGLDHRLRELDEIRASLRRSSDLLTEKIGQGAITADEMLDEQKLQLALAKAEKLEGLDDWREDFTQRVSALNNRRHELVASFEHYPRLSHFVGAQRLLEAFPTAFRNENTGVLSALRGDLSAWREEMRRQVAQKGRQLVDTCVDAATKVADAEAGQVEKSVECDLTPRDRD